MNDPQKQNATPKKETTRKSSQPVPVSDSEGLNAAALQQAVINLKAAKPDAIIGLQRTAGNRAVRGLIQTRLMVGPAGDRYEQEADRIAKQVMNMQVHSGETSSVQKSGVEEVQSKPMAASISRLIRRQEAPEEEEVQMKPSIQRSSDGGFEVGGDVENQLGSARHGGSPLPAEVRSFMEPGFGANFGSVRLHTDSEANTLNQKLGALAFTSGQDIFFKQGEYNPGSSDGKELIAHELTHVVQQNGLQQDRPAAQAQRAADQPAEEEKPIPGDIEAETKMLDGISSLSHQQAGRIQRQENSVTGIFSSIPSGQLDAVLTGNKLHKPFEMKATFNPVKTGDSCAGGEYRQYVRGYFNVNNKPLVHNMGHGNTLDTSKWVEDGASDNTQYGHRAEAAEPGINEYKPDQATGKFYEGHDDPGLKSSVKGTVLEISLDFKGELIDTTNKDHMFVSKTWSVKGKATVP